MKDETTEKGRSKASDFNVIRYLTATNTFKYLGVKKDFFYTTLLKDPTFPKPLFLSAKKKVWDRLSLDNWLQARKSQADLV